MFRDLQVIESMLSWPTGDQLTLDDILTNPLVDYAMAGI